MTVPTTTPALPATPAATRINRRRPNAHTLQVAHRVAGIEIRKELTDSLKRFSDYVDRGGNASSGGPGIYIQLSRRMNAAFGELSQVLEQREQVIAERTESLRQAVSDLDRLSRLLHLRNFIRHNTGPGNTGIYFIQPSP